MDMRTRESSWKRFLLVGVALCGVVVLLTASYNVAASQQGAKRDAAATSPAKNGTAGVPRFEWDPTWPQPFPNGMITSQIGGITVDSANHAWIGHHVDPKGGPRSEIVANGQQSNFGIPAPALLEFDQAGKLLRGLGNSEHKDSDEWESETLRGLTVDRKGNIWVAGLGPDRNRAKPGRDRVIKLDPNGKFLLQIGSGSDTDKFDSNDTANVWEPGGMTIDEAANELYIADGFQAHRVTVFDATTGAYKRHWGAYGKKPDDTYKFGPLGAGSDAYFIKSGGPYPPQFKTVACVRISNDGLVYVCDRNHGRIQVFRKDGTFVKEMVFLPRNTSDMVLSPDSEQRFMYIVDHFHERVWTARRSDGEILGSFGHPGHYGGEFTVAHNITIDRAGNLYVGETWGGRRVQRFLYKGLGTADAAEKEVPRQPPGRFLHQEDSPWPSAH